MTGKRLAASVTSDHRFFICQSAGASPAPHGSGHAARDSPVDCRSLGTCRICTSAIQRVLRRSSIDGWLDCNPKWADGLLTYLGWWPGDACAWMAIRAVRQSGRHELWHITFTTDTLLSRSWVVRKRPLVHRVCHRICGVSKLTPQTTDWLTRKPAGLQSQDPWAYRSTEGQQLSLAQQRAGRICNPGYPERAHCPHRARR